MTSNFTIKIPKEISVFYNKKENKIIFLNFNRTIFIKTYLKISFDKKTNVLTVTSKSVNKKTRVTKKNVKIFQGTLAAKIKQAILETTAQFYKQLQFVGVGYRATNVPNFESDIFYIRLGLSHTLFLKASKKKDFSISAYKMTKLFLLGNSFSKVQQSAAFIRSMKKPEPYKGKGILYKNEKIQLKQGKKI